MKNPSLIQKWLATKGIVIGLCAGLPVLVVLMVFGVNLFTLLALIVCGGLILAGILAFSLKPAARSETGATTVQGTLAKSNEDDGTGAQ